MRALLLQVLLWLGIAASAVAQTPPAAAPRAQPKLSGLLGAQAPARPRAEPELEALRARLEALSRAKDAALIASALERGRSALEAARAAAARGELAVAARKRELGWAAFALASHQLLAAHAADARAAAERRAADAEAVCARERELERAAPASPEGK